MRWVGSAGGGGWSRGVRVVRAGRPALPQTLAEVCRLQPLQFTLCTYRPSYRYDRYYVMEAS